MYRSLQRTTTPPAPFSLDELKQYLHLDGAAEDETLAMLLTAAVDQAEYHTRCQLLTASYEWQFDAWPAGTEILLPRPPLQSVTSVQYWDANAVLQTWSTANYAVDTTTRVGRILLGPDLAWPTLQPGKRNAIAIAFEAGYGAAADVPAGLKLGIKALTAHWYRNREPVVTGTIVAEVPLSMRMVFDRYAVKEFGCAK